MTDQAHINSLGDRIDGDEDLAARERMLDVVECNYYKYENQKLYEHEKLHAAMRDAGPELAAQVSELLGFIDRLVEHSLGCGALDNDSPLWREAAALTGRDPDSGNRSAAPPSEQSTNPESPSGAIG